jgi:hypothetical protein
MMEAARTSETSVDNYFTRQYIPEDKSELHTRRRENLKYRIILEKKGERNGTDIRLKMKNRFREVLAPNKSLDVENS